MFAAVAAALAFAFVYYFRRYMATSRVLKEATGRLSGALVSHVAESLQGLAVVQAYGAQARYEAVAAALLTRSLRAAFNLEMLQLWLSV